MRDGYKVVLNILQSKLERVRVVLVAMSFHCLSESNAVKEGRSFCNAYFTRDFVTDGNWGEKHQQNPEVTKSTQKG